MNTLENIFEIVTEGIKILGDKLLGEYEAEVVRINRDPKYYAAKMSNIMASGF